MNEMEDVDAPQPLQFSIILIHTILMALGSRLLCSFFSLPF